MVGTPDEPHGSPDLEQGVQASEVRRDVLLIGLTCAAGVVDAVSFLGLGQIFTANMTGNVVFLALALGERSFLSALRSGDAFVVFSLAALIAGQVLLRPRPAGTWPRRVTLLLWAQVACMVAFAVAWTSVGGVPSGGVLYILIALSSFGMGLQNAAARHLAVPGLTTTVVTRALTGFMVDLPALGISGSEQRRAAATVASLFTGAAVGASFMAYARVFAPYVTVFTLVVVSVLAYVSFDRPKRAQA